MKVRDEVQQELCNVIEWFFPAWNPTFFILNSSVKGAFLKIYLTVKPAHKNRHVKAASWHLKTDLKRKIMLTGIKRITTDVLLNTAI